MILKLKYNTFKPNKKKQFTTQHIAQVPTSSPHILPCLVTFRGGVGDRTKQQQKKLFKNNCCLARYAR